MSREQRKPRASMTEAERAAAYLGLPAVPEGQEAQLIFAARAQSLAQGVDEQITLRLESAAAALRFGTDVAGVRIPASVAILTYLGDETEPLWAAQAAAFKAWRSAMWQVAISAENAARTTGVLPESVEAVMALMPPLPAELEP